MTTEETPPRARIHERVRFRLLLSGLAGSRVRANYPERTEELAGCLALMRLTPICDALDRREREEARATVEKEREKNELGELCHFLPRSSRRTLFLSFRL